MFLGFADLVRILSYRESGISKWLNLNIDGDLDPRRWNLRRVFLDWMEASLPHPPCVDEELSSTEGILYEAEALVIEALLTAATDLSQVILGTERILFELS